jgi:ribosomal protein S18 acetylase RimI-like enzyme
VVVDTERELSATDLFDRSVATLVQSWRYLASGSPGAEVIETDGAAIAVFVHSPDCEFLNNAVLARGAGDLGATLEVVERAYASRGVERYAVWVDESEAAAAREIETRGYRYDSSTRTMAMPIADLAEVDTSRLELIEPTLEQFWRVDGLDGLVPNLSAERAHFYVCRLNGEDAAMLMAFDHDGDCGIYMVGTRPPARRRGLATTLSAHAVKQASARGCTTVSLQSTEMAESVYAGVGFRDLGRFDEYTPSQSRRRSDRADRQAGRAVREQRDRLLGPEGVLHQLHAEAQPRGVQHAGIDGHLDGDHAP